MPYDELDGWRYAYTDEGSGPPVILLHGLQMDRSMFDHQVDSLRESHRVITIDAPGHGESAGLPVGIDFWKYADMVVAIADRLGVGAAVWGGQSMGGFTALRLALAHPERVTGLVLIDTQAHAEPVEKLAQYEAFLSVALEQGVNEDLVNITLLIYFSQIYAGKPESDVWRKKLLASDVHAQHAMIRAVFDRDEIHDRVAEIRAPAIVIHGDEDIAIEPERAEELAGALANATLVKVPGAGHASPVEDPETVTKAIRGFLAGIA
jgi:pimeloyl-ACP methyl ester carboxylesterase